MAAGRPTIAFHNMLLAIAEGSSVLPRDPASPVKHRGSTRSLICCSAHMGFRPRHNRFKNHGYRTWRDPHGRWHLYRPDDTEITPA